MLVTVEMTDLRIVSPCSSERTQLVVCLYWLLHGLMGGDDVFVRNVGGDLELQREVSYCLYNRLLLHETKIINI
jgi:hypothetical protein